MLLIPARGRQRQDLGVQGQQVCRVSARRASHIETLSQKIKEFSY